MIQLCNRSWQETCTSSRLSRQGKATSLITFSLVHTFRFNVHFEMMFYMHAGLQTIRYTIDMQPTKSVRTVSHQGDAGETDTQCVGSIKVKLSVRLANSACRE